MSLALAGEFTNTGAGVGLQRSAALNRILHFENLMHRRLGTVRPQRYIRLFNYYTSQNLPPDNVEQPLSINYFRAICDKHTSYMWGQWQGDIVGWHVKPRDSDLAEDETSQTIRYYINDLLDANDKNALLWDCSLNSSVYGDGILRLHWDDLERRVVIESILPEWFHCRWDINNMNRLTEVIVSYPIDRLDAEEKYGTSGNPGIDYNLVNPEYLPGFAIYWEHWTQTTYRKWIGDVLLEEGPNPFVMQDAEGNLYPGLIPFVHIPNMRISGEFYGFSDGEAILFIQDEINRRMADMGDAVNNHAHPIVTLKGMGGAQRDLPVGPDAVWDLGREGSAEYLQWKGTPPAVLEYIQTLKDMMHDTANLPDIAFGRGRAANSTGSSKSNMSATAFQMALMPVVERAQQKRIYWDLALKRVVELAVFMHAMRDPATLPFKYTDLRKYEYAPVFAPILPKDRLQTVNEVVARMGNLSMSMQRGLETLGEEDVNEELKRIKQDARFKAQLGMMGSSMGTPPKPGGKNADRGQGGSPAEQNGPGAKAGKPGQPAKSAT